MQRVICLVLCWVHLSFQSGAQSGIEVHYFSPVEKAGGGYTEQVTPYQLLCQPGNSIFFKQGGENTIDFNEQKHRLAMNFSSGKSWVYKDLQDLQLTSLANDLKETSYLIRESIPSIKWQILKTTKSIQGILVQKARAQFRGRQYTAWFAPDIPIANGPWKLGGLPGLILEAYDDERLVVFLFRSLHFKRELTIEMPRVKAATVDLLTYQELFKEEIQQYFRFLNARLTSEGSGLSYEFGEFEPWERLD